MTRHYANGSLVVPAFQAKSKANPDTELLDEDARSHYAITGSLFPRLPSVADVVQGGIGDCGLLAAILAILNTGDDWGVTYVQGMMADKTFTVVVRLFEDSGQPTFVRVRKSIPKTSLLGDSGISRGALWVQMLEKAVAAAEAGKYSAGLSPETAFKRLLGTTQLPTEHREVLRSRLFTYLMQLCSQSGSAKNLEALAKLEDRHKLAWSPGNVEEYLEIFKGDRAKLDIWTNWIDKHWGDEWNYGNYTRKHNIRLFTEEDFQAWFPIAATDLDNDTRDAVSDWVSEGGVLPGALFTGKYGKEQIEMYKTIKNALKAGRPVTANTPDKFPNALVKQKQMQADGSAGEVSLDGIYAKHYYAVVKTSKQGGIRYVHVRNPHGETGRGYDNKAPKRVQDAESKLELSDFTRTFVEFTIGGGVKNAIPSD